MKKYLSLFLFLTLPLFGAVDEYAELLKSHPELITPKGDHKNGEIEIVTDPDKIQEIQQLQYQRLRDIGIPGDRASKWTKVGEIARDRYSVWVRDAVIFPSGAAGLYNRFISEAALKGNIGAAVLPVFPNGDIALIVQFRHATRSWELELPRGGGSSGETALDSAKRELQEEAGLQAKEWILLGTMTPDSGTLQSKVPVYLAKDLKVETANLEESEAIEGVIRLSRVALNQAIKKGSIELKVRGSLKEVFVRDSFLIFALYLNSLSDLNSLHE